MSAVGALCCHSCTEGSRQLILCLVRRMAADLDLRVIAGLTALVLLAFIGARAWYHRRLASRMFADGDWDAEALQGMHETLEEVNRESRTHTFSAERVSTISLRDHAVTLVDGWIVVQTAEGADHEKCVFAVAHRDDADRLRHSPDVFNLVFAGSVWSVFWVKLATLMRLTKRCS